MSEFYEKYMIFSWSKSIQRSEFVILCVLCEIMEKYNFMEFPEDRGTSFDRRKYGKKCINDAGNARIRAAL